MSGDPENDRLEDMAARIRLAKVAPDESRGPMQAETSLLAQAGRIGFDFVATLGVCIGLGWGVDHWYLTSPWGILSGTAIGFVAGIRNVWRGLDKKE